MSDISESVSKTNAKYKEILDDQPDELRCPECGNITNVYSVNSGPRDQVGGNYRSVVSCFNFMDCGWEEYSDKKASSMLSIRGKIMYKHAVKNGAILLHCPLTR